MKVKTFTGCFCSQKFFARLLNKSSSGIYYLRLLGVVSYCPGGVLIYRSLQRYFYSYLPPNKSRAEIDAALNRIDNLLTVNEVVDCLSPARVLKKKIAVQFAKVTLLDFFRKLFPSAVDFARLQSAALQLSTLQQELKTTKEELSRRIIAANIRPRQIENILLYRYVDCLSFEQVAEYSGYSVSYSKFLHRRGRKIFFAQD